MLFEIYYKAWSIVIKGLSNVPSLSVKVESEFI